MAETYLRLNPDTDCIRRAPENQKEHENIFLPKAISQRKIIRESSGTGDNIRTGSVYTESVESNEVGHWYGVSCFDKRNSDAVWNPEFANIDGYEVFQHMESGGKRAVEYRK